MSNWSRRDFSVGAAALVAASLSLPAVASAAAPRNVIQLDDPVAVPPFSLEDHHGNPFGLDQLKGGWSLIMLGFTHCPDVCPFTLSNLTEVVSQTAARVRPDNLPRVVFVGVDPERDKPILGDYVTHFDPRYVGITGSHEQLAVLTEGIDGFYRLKKKHANDDNYDVQHSAAVVLVDPKGRIQAKMAPPFNPGVLAEYIARRQIAYRRAIN